MLWSEVAGVLTALFQQNTGRALDKDQLNYLARTAFSMLLLLLLLLDQIAMHDIRCGLLLPYLSLCRSQMLVVLNS